MLPSEISMKPCKKIAAISILLISAAKPTFAGMHLIKPASAGKITSGVDAPSPPLWPMDGIPPQGLPLPAASAEPIPGEHFRALLPFLGSRQTGEIPLIDAKDEPPDAILSRLNGMRKIRAYFMHAPGFGHQTSTLSIIRRLRQLGYAGEIEAVYDNAPELADKLAILFPGFDPKRYQDGQRMPGLDITLENADSFAKRPKEPVVLAVTGGDEHGSAARPTFFNSEIYLDLSPLGWRSGDAIWSRGESHPRAIPAREHLAFIYPPASQESLHDEYFENLSRTSIGPKKSYGLKALASDIQNHELLPGYGLAFLDGTALHGLLLAVSTSLDRDPSVFKRRGVIIPLLLDVPDKVSEVLGRLNQPMSANRDLRRRLQIAEITDADLPKILRNLGEDKILLLKSGPIPPPLFEVLFAQSTLPPTLEGKNALNLAALLGIPFLPVRGKTLNDLFRFIPAQWADDLKTEVFIKNGLSPEFKPPRDIARALASGSSEEDVKTIADFILEVLQPGSLLREMFGKARIRQDDYRRDKLLNGLREAFPLRP